jgi:hypothetical protein
LFNASELKIEPVAYLLLVVGALGDWVSTRFGVSLGLVEGNTMAASLMSSGRWMITDFLVVAVCILVPYVLNRMVKRRVSGYFIGFPLVAGVIKIGVSLWNLNLILS